MEHDRFSRLMLPHMDAAYNFARYLSRDTAAAEDVVQEAFLRAFRSINTCRGNEKAWLFAIVRNCFHDWIRANARGGEACSPAESGALDDGDNPEIIMLHRVAEQGLRAAVEALPEPFREALVLREFEEISYRDIAKLTGVPMGTVMSRLSRARQMLADVMLTDEEGATSI